MHALVFISFSFSTAWGVHLDQGSLSCYLWCVSVVCWPRG